MPRNPTPPGHEFAQRIILEYIGQLQQALAGTEQGAGIEPLHQARVISRRLRMALGIFKKQFDRIDRDQAKTALRELEKALGPARDLDTEFRFLTSLTVDHSQGGVTTGALQVIKELEQDRRKLQPGVVKAVQAIRQGKTLERIAGALGQPAGAAGKEVKKASLLLEKLGRKRIKKRLKRLLGYEPYIDDPDNVRKLHRLRIAAKYLRFTLEIFEPYYGKKLDKYIAAAHTIQNTLGDHHDYDVWQQSLARRASRTIGDPVVRGSIRQCAALCAGRRPQAYREFFKAWKQQREQKLWHKLAKTTTEAQRHRE